MKHTMQNLLLGGSTVALVAASAFFTVPAFAQNANSTDIETVVVTGTSIRGVAPVGSNLITVGQEEITKTGAQNVQQLLANVPAVSGMGNGGEGGAIHRAVEHEGRDQPFSSEPGEEGGCLPVAARRAAEGACSNVRPGMAPRHVRPGAGFIKEDQPACQIRLHPSPVGARRGHVRPFLFAGVHGFF